MVTVAATDSLVVTAPAGATYQPVTVTAGGLTGAAEQPFIITFPGIQSPQFDSHWDFSTDQSGAFNIGDLDGDGRPDVAMMATFPGGNGTGVAGFLLFQNSSAPGTLGPGSLGTAQPLNGSYPGVSGGSARAAVMVDLDGDGKLDLVETYWFGDLLVIFRNIGTSGNLSASSFAQAVVLNVPGLQPAPAALAVADLDGDGRPDILLLRISGGLSVLRNLTSPGNINSNSFAPPVNLATGISPFAVAVADLDGDGKLDVVTLTAGGLTLLRNIGAGPGIDASTFGAPVPLNVTGDTFAVGDIDGDGKPDLVTLRGYPAPNTTTTILRNLTTGPGLDTNSFGQIVELSGPYATTGGAIALGDLNGDGKVDLVTTSPNNTGRSAFSIFINQGSSGMMSTNSFSTGQVFSVSTENGFPVAIADVDLDGKADILLSLDDCCPSQVYLSVYHNTTPEVPPFVSIASPTNQASFIAPADIPLKVQFSQDASSVVEVRFFTNNVLLGSSSNAPFDLLWPSVAAGVYTLRALALDSGGIISTSPPVKLIVYRSPGAAPPVIVSFSPASGPIGTIVTITGANFSPAPSENVVYFGAVQAQVAAVGSNSIAVLVPPGTTYQPLTVTAGGLTATAKIPFVSTFPGRRHFQTDSPSDYGTSVGYPRTLNIGDFDGDGKPDVAILNAFGNQNGPQSAWGFSLYQNASTPGLLGPSSFRSPVALFPDYPTGVSVVPMAPTVMADLDGDGKLDLVLEEFWPSQLVLFRNISSPGQLSAASFAPGVILSLNGQLVGGMGVADVDGDGRPEIILARYGGVSILRNLTSPGQIDSNSFAAPVDFATVSNSTGYGIVIADFDSDGKPDVATIIPGGVALLRNTSTGPGIDPSTFASPVTGSTGPTSPGGLAAGDIDGDGKVDLVVLYGSTISILRNLTSGPGLDANSFGEQADIAGYPGTTSGMVAIGDLNGDGKLDLALTTINNSGQSSLAVFINQGSPGSISSNSFAPEIDFSVNTQNPFWVALADIDGDGKPDIVLENEHFIVYHNATGSFSNLPPSVSVSSPVAGTTLPAPADILLSASASDSDGSVTEVDFYSGGALLGVSTNTPFSFLWTNVSTGTYTLTASAIDNEGGTSTSAPVTITLYAAPSGVPPVVDSFTPVSGRVGTLVTILGSNFSLIPSNNVVYFGGVQAQVQSAAANALVVLAPAGAAYQPPSVTTGGLTGTAKRAFLLTFAGSQSFRANRIVTEGQSPDEILLGDLDGDGHLDLAGATTFTTDHAGHTMGGFLLYHNASAEFAAAGSFYPDVPNPTADAGASALADLDGDGKLDLLLLERLGYFLVIYRNIATNGSVSPASFASPVMLSISSDPYGVAVADLDGDGRPEIILSLYHRISVLRNLTSPGNLYSNSFAAPVDFLADTTPYGVLVADLDLDGRPDIATITPGGMTLLRNMSIGPGINPGTFGAPVFLATPPNITVPILGDVDGDGRADLVTMAQSGQNATILLFRNLTSGPGLTTNSFAPAVQIPAQAVATLGSTALADMNGDGKVDLVIMNPGNNSGASVSVFLNRGSPGTISSNTFSADQGFGLPQGYNSYSLAVGDVDGDGRPDVILPGGGGGNSLLVAYNTTPPPPNVPPAVAIIAPTNGASFTAPAAVTISANATDSDGTVLQVSFFSGPDLLGSTDTAPYTYYWSNVVAGTYSLTAVATDNSGATSNSSAVTITVIPPPVTPLITASPQSQSVEEGSNVTFSVTASGTAPLTYAWLLFGTNMVGVNSNTLTLAHISFNSGGPYSVIVSNAAGSVTSNPAMLTVLPLDDRLVQARSANAAPGTSVQIPIDLAGQGNENAVEFSVSFPPSILSYAGTQLGSGAGGAVLNANETQTASGRLGVSLALSAGDTFGLGTQELVVVTFQVAAGIGNSTVGIDFGDTPLARDISDPIANELGASYIGGSVVIQGGGYEGDVTPVPDGNGEVSVTDWIKVGRYAAGLDPVPTASQFQRADCAPRSTLGNGTISLTDWVQAGRYAAGLDPLTPAGGPTTPAGGVVGKSIHAFAQAEAGESREVIIPKIGLRPGHTNRVPVLLVAQGNESAIGLSLSFDPSVLVFVNGSVGTNAALAVLNMNSTGAATGRLGLVLSLPIGTNTFASGTQEVAILRFVAASNAIGTEALFFGDQPALREVSDAFANTLTATFSGGVLFITPPLRIAPATILTWPAWASNAVIEATDALSSAPAWSSPTTSTSNLVSGEIQVTIPHSPGQRFFRLRVP